MHIYSKIMTCRELRNDAIAGRLSIRCPSAKWTKKDQKLPQTTMYVFTNTKKVDIISAQKYFRDLPKEQITGIDVEKEPAIGPVIQQIETVKSDLPQIRRRYTE